MHGITDYISQVVIGIIFYCMRFVAVSTAEVIVFPKSQATDLSCHSTAESTSSVFTGKK